MTAEGWNHLSIRQHVEAVAAEAARGHERLDEVDERLDGIGEAIEALIETFRKIVEASDSDRSALAGLPELPSRAFCDQVSE